MIPSDIRKYIEDTIEYTKAKLVAHPPYMWALAVLASVVLSLMLQTAWDTGPEITLIIAPIIGLALLLFIDDVM